MTLNQWTVCACIDCGFPVVGEHDCERQRAENDEPTSRMGMLERLVLHLQRRELIRAMAKK